MLVASQIVEKLVRRDYYNKSNYIIRIKLWLQVLREIMQICRESCRIMRIRGKAILSPEYTRLALDGPMRDLSTRHLGKCARIRRPRLVSCRGQVSRFSRLFYLMS